MVEGRCSKLKIASVTDEWLDKRCDKIRPLWMDTLTLGRFRSVLIGNPSIKNGMSYLRIDA